MVVSLLALLVLALVSLATLTRIETQVGMNSRKQAQARQNARAALETAVAELQRHAGADTRLTATGDILPVALSPGIRHWTSVWDSADPSYRAWLVSGSENIASPVSDPTASLGVSPALAHPQSPLVPLEITGGASDVPCQLLAGSKTLGSVTSGYVVAPLVDLEAPAADGSGDVTVGRYAWWIADEGVKASLALRDRIDEVDYGPWASTELRNRLRQQVPMAHQGFRATDGTGFAPRQGFDPAVTANETLLSNVIVRNQIPFLTEAAGSLLTSTRNRFHDWTTISSGVLASTNPTYPGLKRDLSRDPSLLGLGFEAWSDYETHMEGFPSPSTVHPRIQNADDFRRRYVMTPPAAIVPDPGSIVHSVSPVVSNLVLLFSFRRLTGDAVEIGARMHVELWNPYTSALVPEELRLEIGQLPTVQLRVGALTRDVSLQSAFNTRFGGTFRVNLPFDTGNPDPEEDRDSWLPGRVQNWRTGTSGLLDDTSADPALPDLRFGAKRVTRSIGWRTVVTGPTDQAGDLVISGPAPIILATLQKSVSGVGWVALAEYECPPMPTYGGTWSATVASGSTSQPSPGNDARWRLGFGMRLRQRSRSGLRDEPSWLETPSQDPRRTDFSWGNLDYHEPAQSSPTHSDYGTGVRTEWSSVSDGFLLNRDTGGGVYTSYTNDTPVFELPRSPILSLGALQHLQIAEARPFSVGNSWGAAISVPASGGYTGGTIGSWFDRFFFSGSVVAGFSGADDRPDGAPAEPFPFYHLRVVDTRANPSTSFVLGTVRNAGAFSSQFLLMKGAFNVNSTSVDAWEAVLRSIRPGAMQSWTVGDLNPSTGGAVDDGGDAVVLSPAIADATQGASEPSNRPSGFFRFSQTAQETFESNPDSAATVSGFNRTRYREAFRGGSGATGEEAQRNLSSDQIRTLAGHIVTQVRTYGPLRTMEQFVGPAVGGASVIERAISAANLNSGLTGMSSLFLTQADVLTAIGPFLQCRSDTFLIRTYGEALNPVTGEVDSRAWCEATVQRIPTRVDGGDITAGATGLGRRFVITSFRWLSPDDI